MIFPSWIGIAIFIIIVILFILVRQRRLAQQELFTDGQSAYDNRDLNGSSNKEVFCPKCGFQLDPSVVELLQQK